jgi:hypothetical protein
MSFRNRIVIFAGWVASILVVGVLVSAQTQPGTAPAVISGEDIGFRPDAVQRSRERISGTFVVRVNGQWVEAQFSPRPVPAAD